MDKYNFDAMTQKERVTWHRLWRDWEILGRCLPEHVDGVRAFVARFGGHYHNATAPPENWAWRTRNRER